MEAAMEQMNIASAKRLMVQNRKEVAEVANRLAEYQAELDRQIEAMQKAFEETHFDDLLVVKELTEIADEYEQFLREQAIAHYERTGEKTLDENLGVRVTTKLEYEMPLAVAWCDQNAPVLVQKVIDRKVFEKFPGVADLEFVTKIETPSAVLKGL